MIAIDIETYDPNLQELGPGCVRHDGYILCVGTYDGKRSKSYTPEDSDWPELVERLASNEDKVFHNGVYDLGWLCVGYNLKVNGTMHDTMTRACFIDEYASLGLDDCCKRMNVAGKNKEDTIELWFETNKKELGLKGSLWSNVLAIWHDPEGRQLMLKYNAQDCKATYDLFFAQEPYMKPYAEPYQMECDLYPLLMHLKKNGVRIDTEAMDRLHQVIRHDLEVQTEKMWKDWRLTPEIVRSTKQLGELLNSMGIHSEIRTSGGKESWNATAMDKIKHPIAQDILAYKASNSLLVKYLEGSMARCIYEGRIHCDFSPNKREDGGAITGRFASSSPNLQNISAREFKHGFKTYGDEMRALFIPEPDQWMLAVDYSQIEYVLFMHFAVGPQAEELRDQIRAGTDFHTATMKITGITERYLAKTVNYGTLYGMGFNAMLEGDNYPTWEKEGAKQGMSAYDFCKYCRDLYATKLPMLQTTCLNIQNEAKMFGYVTSLGGRRHHNPKATFDPSTGRWNNGLYKMTNYKIQGSASEVLKKALVTSWKSGVFDTLKMHLTVHDENVCSVPKTKEGVEAAVELERCMDMAYSEVLNVPIRATGGIGDNWNGKHSEDDWQKLRIEYGMGSSSDMQKQVWSLHHTSQINTLEDKK